MTDRLRAAAEAALEALERSRAYVYETDRPQIDGSMDSLRAALAEPDQLRGVTEMIDDRLRIERLVRANARRAMVIDIIERLVEDPEREDFGPSDMEYWSPLHDALQAKLRAALAEPEAASEPFVWYDDDTGETWTPGAVQDGGAPDGLRPLYAAPIKQDVPATDFGNMEPVAWYLPSDEGCDSMFRDHRTVVTCTGNPWTGWQPLYTAPPSALAEPEVEQEPADDVWFEDRNGAIRKSPRDCQRFGAAGVPEAVWVNGDRYVRREWVGLTDEEKLQFVRQWHSRRIETIMDLVGEIEAKLKEKNA